MKAMNQTLTSEAHSSGCDQCAERSAERSADFSRRVEVEQWLLDASKGKRPLPTAEECRSLAHMLGIPHEFAAPPTTPSEESDS